MIPPGCWPVVRRTPTQPCTIRSISQFRFAGASLFIVIFHIAEGRLIRQRTDGSCPEGLSCTENNLRIFVGLTLVITGEVQVDIRLLVSLKSQEGLKGNIKSLLLSAFCRTPGSPCPAYRSPPSRISFHILRVKVTVMAGGTDIVRPQRIYLRNSRHGSNEGGTYRTTGTYQIAVIVGFPHQLLGNDVHHRESVGDDGIQFPLQPLRYHCPADLLRKSHGPCCNRYHAASCPNLE